jgi:acyl transferase domain-containing protein
MLRDLAIQFPEVRELFELGDQVLAERLAKPLSGYFFPRRALARKNRALQQALTQTDVAQPALGVAGLAMFRMLQALGLQPDFAAGHSYGEYVALAAAGVLSKETLITLAGANRPGKRLIEPGEIPAYPRRTALYGECRRPALAEAGERSVDPAGARAGGVMSGCGRVCN